MDSLIDGLDVAEPCSASWDAMSGDERKRFCGDCKLHVYNFSAMRSGEVEALLRNAESRVCGRFLRRADGTVVTQDCGPIRRAIQKRVRRLRVAAGALFALLTSLPTLGCGAREEVAASATAAPDATKQHPPKLTPGTPPEPIELMGEVAFPQEVLGRICPPEQAPKPAPQTPQKGAAGR